MAETAWADFRAAIDRRIAEEIAHEPAFGAQTRAEILPRVQAAVAAARAAGACSRV